MIDSLRKSSSSPLIQSMVLAIIAVLASFLWQGHAGFSLWDEGFLWYGTQRVMLGEVPIRDFQAYDIGRYYWSASLMSLYGSNGIMALRGTVAVFQIMGLFIGLYLIASSSKKSSFLYLILSTLTLTIWMYPRHKLFDISLSIISIGILTFLIQHPTKKRCFFTGFFVGLIAVFARNHGFYSSIGSILAIFWLSIHQNPGSSFTKNMLYWLSGLIVGLTPFFLFLIFVPGYVTAFMNGIHFMLDRGSTNLHLPIPWPWKVNAQMLSNIDALREILKGVFFIILVIFSVLSITWLSLKKIKHKEIPSSFIAAMCLNIPYTHYAYSRADIGHLALSIFPLIIGMIILFSVQKSKIKWISLVSLFTASIFLMLPNHPGWECFTEKCVATEISNSTLFVKPKTAEEIELLHKLVAQYSPKEQSFLVTPFWPGAYALFERKSPMWAVYAILKRGDAFEKKEIERIKDAHPTLVIIIDTPLDGRDELRFKNTHPLIYNYIVSNFEHLSNSPNPMYQLFKEKK